MNLATKSPILKPSDLLVDGKLIQLKYIDSAPLNYRFNASSQGGTLNFEGMRNADLTNVGEAFDICPIAYRAFQSKKFGREKSQIWVELFFLNIKGQASCLMVHSASAENFLNVAKLLAYEDLKISDVKLRIAPRTKSNKESGNDYYVCDFSYTEFSNDERLLSDAIVQEIGSVYRRSTFDNYDKIISFENYPQDLIDVLSVFNPAELPAFVPDDLEEKPINDALLVEMPSNVKGVKRAA